MELNRTQTVPSSTLWFAAFALAGVALAAVPGCGPERREVGFPPPSETPKLERPPKEQVQPLDPALAQAARQELNAAASGQDPILRVHAIEGEREALGTEATADYLRGLNDPAPVVRFAAAMAVGELKLNVAKGTLLGLVNDRNKYVWIGVRFALHRLGTYTYSHDLEKAAVDKDPFVRGQTAMILGRLGEPSAIKVLMVLRKDEKPLVRQQASEALWRLGNPAGEEDMVGLISSSFPDDQILGILGLASTHDSRVRQHIRPKLSSDYDQVRLVAAWAYGMIGGDPYDIGYPIAVNGAKNGDPRLRVLAARALGAIGRTDEQPLLRDLLKDPDPEVRVAAATAILQLTPPEKRPAGE